MSQKVNPHALRSQLRGTQKKTLSRSPASIHEIFFSEPKNSKWGLNSYSRIFHEDQSIEKYLEGFFRSFGFYQQTCVIERKCNQTVHVTAYVLRTPQVRTNPNIIHRTPKEKVLQEGLDLPIGNSTKVGWVPTLLLQTITKILSTSSGPSNDANVSTWYLRHTKGINEQHNDIITGNHPHKVDLITVIPVDMMSSTLLTPDLTPIISSNGDYNSELQQQTEESRFKSYWNNLLAVSESDVDISTWSGPSKSIPPTGFQGYNRPSASASWWSHRTWHTKIIKESEIRSNSPQYVDSGNIRIKDSKCQQGYNLSLSIVPVQSLSDSSKLIADYMADKIEQSAPLQGLFQEITGILKLSDNTTRNADNDSHMDMKSNNQVEQLPKIVNSLNTTVVESCPKPIIGFRLSCSGRIQKSAYAKPAEIADSLTVTQGVLPLNSFNHNIEFTQTSSTNAFGTCGIKVWINRGV